MNRDSLPENRTRSPRNASPAFIAASASRSSSPRFERVRVDPSCTRDPHSSGLKTLYSNWERMGKNSLRLNWPDIIISRRRKQGAYVILYIRRKETGWLSQRRQLHATGRLLNALLGHCHLLSITVQEVGSAVVWR